MILSIQGTIGFVILGLILLFIVCFLGIRIFLEKRKDQEEIDEIIANLVDTKPREEVKEVVEVEKKSNIEEMLAKMEQDLNTKPEDVVTNFEQEQEEKSIISYQELVRTINPQVEKKPIQMKEEVKPQLFKKREEPANKKFKNTDFISPVYGKLEEHLEYPTVPSFEKKEQVRFDFTKEAGEFEKSLAELKRKENNIQEYLNDFKGSMEIDNLEQVITPTNTELKKNDEFLEALKEFRKNLD